MARTPKEPTIQFTVEGRGIFPIDMLRYDCCYPASQEDVNALTHCLIWRRQHDTTYRITLKAVREYRREPTEARWKSYGWTVIKD